MLCLPYPCSDPSSSSYGKSGGGGRGDFLGPGVSGLRFLGHPESSQACSVDGFWVSRTSLSLLPSGAGFPGTRRSGKVSRPREEWWMAVRCSNTLARAWRCPTISHGSWGPHHPPGSQAAPRDGNLVAMSQELMCLLSSRVSPTGSPT